MIIGFRIKEARKARRRTQKWLADEVGVKQSSVSQWEMGETEPTTANCSSVAQALRISFEWLTTGRGEMDVTYASAVVHVAEPGQDLDDDKKELLALFDQLPKKKRQILLQFMRDWAATK
ncbi:helix-turn-helix domain-containing protein [Pseudogulbenkiania ferrooxidans]|uniref:Transcriptional regulator, XRE family n=1 Tax=Pseudogulbenkiania ferrooxidans 2002 TaxID=279714 RepID=B9Z4Y0_9NEIS|nr:helix-turn-helix domain-containing protein [Pseudogulbenkiania ferrooxidans]EEG08212.1 transcriptional regulator, XRE family [Pseudogulbenkiania ferrooxidans 2002]